MTSTPPETPVSGPVSPADPEVAPEATDDAHTPQPPEDDNGQKGSNREARYRRELRETQGERDTLRQQVDALRRAEAERLSGLSRPAALWAAGTQLADLLDDDGHLDAAKVADATQAATDQLGAAPAPRTPRADHSQGGSGQPAGHGDTWAGAFSAERPRG